MTNKKIKILCAEDEVDIRENIVDILEDEGFEVLAAEDGAKALKILEETDDINIVISDIMMPNLSGLEFLKKVRDTEFHSKNIPFILLTALSSKDDVIKGSDYGANDYIVKPIDFDILIAKIKEKISNSESVNSSFDNKISNIKDQISNILPNDMIENVKIISHISEVLKTEPYGPFSHEKYLSDIGKIYDVSLKLRALMNNFLESDNVVRAVDVKYEIISPVKLVDDLIADLSPKLQKIICLDTDPELQVPNIKVSKILIIESIKKTLSILLKAHLGGVGINIVVDHLGRVVFIMTLKDPIEQDDVSSKFTEKNIAGKLREAGYDFDVIFNNKEFSALIFIPTHKVINSMYEV